MVRYAQTFSWNLQQIITVQSKYKNLGFMSYFFNF